MNNRPDKSGPHRQAFERNRKYIMSTQSICGICGKPVDISIRDYLDPMAPVIDHIIPIARGGHPSDLNNLQLAHRWCNRMKADKLFDAQNLFKAAATEVKNDVLPLHCDWTAYRGE